MGLRGPVLRCLFVRAVIHEVVVVDRAVVWAWHLDLLISTCLCSRLMLAYPLLVPSLFGRCEPPFVLPGDLALLVGIRASQSMGYRQLLPLPVVLKVVHLRHHYFRSLRVRSLREEAVFIYSSRMNIWGRM